jgi:hypothetical protein
MNKIISNKNGIIMEKINNNKYSLSTIIQNQNINMREISDISIMNFFVKYKYEFCDIIEFTQINKEEGIILFLFKHFFEDVGFPQYYFYKYVTTELLENNDLIFHLKTKKDLKKSPNIPLYSEEYNFDVIDIILQFHNNTEIKCILYVEISDDIEMYGFLEKIAALILNKIVIILKYILENYHNLNNINDNKS